MSSARSNRGVGRAGALVEVHVGQRRVALISGEALESARSRRESRLPRDPPQAGQVSSGHASPSAVRTRSASRFESATGSACAPGGRPFRSIAQDRGSRPGGSRASRASSCRAASPPVDGAQHRETRRTLRAAVCVGGPSRGWRAMPTTGSTRRRPGVPRGRRDVLWVVGMCGIEPSWGKSGGSGRAAAARAEDVDDRGDSSGEIAEISFPRILVTDMAFDERKLNQAVGDTKSERLSAKLAAACGGLGSDEREFHHPERYAARQLLCGGKISRHLAATRSGVHCGPVPRVRMCVVLVGWSGG